MKAIRILQILASEHAKREVLEHFFPGKKSIVYSFLLQPCLCRGMCVCSVCFSLFKLIKALIKGFRLGASDGEHNPVQGLPPEVKNNSSLPKEFKKQGKVMDLVEGSLPSKIAKRNGADPGTLISLMSLFGFCCYSMINPNLAWICLAAAPRTAAVFLGKGAEIRLRKVINASQPGSLKESTKC